MKIVIKSEESIDLIPFAYSYLPRYIYKMYLSYLDTKRLNVFSQQLKKDVKPIIDYVITHLQVSRVGDNYILSTNKSLKVNGQPVMPIINFITYGNRTTKGYPILAEIFKEVSLNIGIIYKE